MEGISVQKYKLLEGNSETANERILIQHLENGKNEKLLGGNFMFENKNRYYFLCVWKAWCFL